MKRRKTIDVDVVVDTANLMLKESTVAPRGDQFRRGVTSLLEQLLFITNQYGGFRYLTESEVPPGELPGIRTQNLPSPNGMPSDEYCDKLYIARFTNTDNTRAKYSMKKRDNAKTK